MQQTSSHARLSASVLNDPIPTKSGMETAKRDNSTSSRAAFRAPAQSFRSEHKIEEARHQRAMPPRAPGIALSGLGGSRISAASLRLDSASSKRPSEATQRARKVSPRARAFSVSGSLGVSERHSSMVH